MSRSTIIEPLRRCALRAFSLIGIAILTQFANSQILPSNGPATTGSSPGSTKASPRTPDLDVLTSRPASESSADLVWDWRDVQKWPLETVELTDGRKLHGLIKHQTPGIVDLLQIKQVPGRPTILIARTFPISLIISTKSLSTEQRNLLNERIERFRNQSLEEIHSMSNLELHDIRITGQPIWSYEKNAWFRLESHAEEELTRRAVVRLEQMFNAFAEILPPRTLTSTSKDQLRVYLFSTKYNYLDLQRKYGQKLQNPAIYLAKPNILAAGDELLSLTKEIAEIRTKNSAVALKYKKDAAEIPKKIQEFSKELEAQGRTKQEIKQVIGAMRSKLNADLERKRNELTKTEKNNSVVFDNHANNLFQRLYHESFHAYLENYVYPSDRYDVPRWLNEGLAQIFEEGVIEAGTLRLDIPSPTRLARLQNDLRTGQRIPLEQLLNSEPAMFLVDHQSDSKTSERMYLYSWGLAYYLAVHEPVLQAKALDQYVSKDASKMKPKDRFEILINKKPLDVFEKQWRDAILNWPK